MRASRGSRQRSRLWAAWLALVAFGCDCRAKKAEENGAPERATAQTPSAAPAPLTAAPVPPMCADVCRHAPALQCGTTNACVDGCKLMLALPVCQSEVLAFLSCAAAEPDSHWECDKAGPTPSLKQGYCATDRAALTGCLSKSTGGPPPP